MIVFTAAALMACRGAAVSWMRGKKPEPESPSLRHVESQPGSPLRGRSRILLRHNSAAGWSTNPYRAPL